MDIIKLFGKLTEHESELKQPVESEVKSKKRENVKEENKGLSLKASTSMKKKNKDEDDSSDKVSSKEEEMALFFKCYNQYMRKHKLKHSDKNLINFKKSYPQNKEHKIKEKDVTCFDCGKFGHYKITCPSLNKHHKKKDIEFYKTKGKHANGLEPTLLGKKKMGAPLHI